MSEPAYSLKVARAAISLDNKLTPSFILSQSTLFP